MDIRQVQTRRDARLFLRFPWKVYAGDPHWVPPLLAAVRDKLDTRRHPFFRHGEAASFLAFRDGEPIGRIVAIVDQNHNEAINRFAASLGAVVYKKYRIYERKISEKGA